MQTGKIPFCSLPKGNSHKILGAHIGCAQAGDINGLTTFRHGLSEPAGLKVDANSGASILTCAAQSDVNQPCSSSWNLLWLMILESLTPEAEHRHPANVAGEAEVYLT